MSMGHAEAESIIATAWMHGFECDLQKEKSAEMFKTSGDKGKKIKKKINKIKIPFCFFLFKIIKLSQNFSFAILLFFLICYFFN